MEQTAKGWISNHIPTKRRLIQLYSALLYNAHLKGFITGKIYTGKLKAVCVPGLNCYSCPGAIGACPIGSLQASLASSNLQAPFYIVGIILLYGLIAGRTICGYFCPFGLIQELLFKLPTFKIKKSRATRALSYFKYLILAVFVFGITLWYGLERSMAVPAFCKYICPAGTLEGAMGLISNPNNRNYLGMLGIFFTRKFVIMLVIGLMCVFCYRSFCRFLCPLGALYGMFNRLSLIGVKVDMDRCNGCGSCVRNCRMDVKRVGDHECIYCGQCIGHCAKGALSMKAGNLTLIPPKDMGADEVQAVTSKKKEVKRTAVAAAILALIAVILWVNLSSSSGARESAVGNLPPETESGKVSEDSVKETAAPDSDNNETLDTSAMYTNNAPEGYNVGDRLKDFTAQCIDGTTFHLMDQRGKVVIINLWATWCGPCVKELPYLSEFCSEHQDDLVILACHSSNVTQDVQEFLGDKDWDISFTIDNDENGIFEKTGGSGVLPQTIVLNRKGEVVYNEIRAITPQALEKLYEEASGTDEGIPEAATEVPERDEVTAETAEEADDNDVVNGAASKEMEEERSAESGSAIKETEVASDDPPDFEITCVDGTSFSLKKSVGKPVAIVFWGSYSDECLEYLDSLNNAAGGSDSFDILAISNYYSKGDPGEIARERGWKFKVAVDDKEESAFKLFGASMAVPRTLIINRDGDVVFNEKRSLTIDEIQSYIGD